jgi:hypothetical protein
LSKQLPYTHLLKALPRFVSDETTREVLQHVTFREGKLCATNGHILISINTKHKGFPKHEGVEGVLYTLSLAKEAAVFTPSACDSPFPQVELLLKLPPDKESFVEGINVGDYLGVTRYTANSSLTDLAYLLNREDYKVQLHYLSLLPLEQSYKIQARKAEPGKDGLGPVHFFNDAVHCICMPLRK